MNRDPIGNVDIFIGHLKKVLYKFVYHNHISFRGNSICSGSIRIRCNEGSIIVSDGVKLNSNVILHTTGNGKILIGNGTGIKHRVIIASKNCIRIGRNVMIGPNVCVYDHDHIYKTTQKMMVSGFLTSPIIIEDNVWIGSNCTILKGSHIGTGSVIAAGTVIKGKIPPNSIVFNGNKNIIRQK